MVKRSSLVAILNSNESEDDIKNSNPKSGEDPNLLKKRKSDTNPNLERTKRIKEGVQIEDGKDDLELVLDRIRKEMSEHVSTRNKKMENFLHESVSLTSKCMKEIAERHQKDMNDVWIKNIKPYKEDLRAFKKTVEDYNVVVKDIEVLTKRKKKLLGIISQQSENIKKRNQEIHEAWSAFITKHQTEISEGQSAVKDKIKKLRREIMSESKRIDLDRVQNTMKSLLNL